MKDTFIQSIVFMVLNTIIIFCITAVLMKLDINYALGIAIITSLILTELNKIHITLKRKV